MLTLVPLPELPVRHLRSLTATAEAITVSAELTAPTAGCPLCGQVSQRVHSRYTRTLADLPCGGWQLILRLTVRRFACCNPDCPRAIFAEPSAIGSSPMRTTRDLADAHQPEVETDIFRWSRLAAQGINLLL